ncbi:N-acetyl-1-D-myo-inositol-2-amino-2-deoxy-alpha-D-glucopyranoside deacetylase [Herbihabitans rhizosphaerae]|uniref:1D-myo-inositol 2-acetamido-2-deoxy-alpha-D-glucopyranoside deacetylase n=2 Tax=Herbihabitans rhizosphaerae TaxID=1872711 RepID=A0A4Q7L7K5_9PSEU|nr:N-acetyl-1-D-myo-inositol-2-amino-2-deoxy-alpha-D-glucopyranoside deacetylase [Herbihabitans rhizosphaerae]
MLSAPRRLLLVHAHPDDESLTTGGTIARYAAAGAHVSLVTCTLGEEGEIIPDSLAQLASAASDQLGGYRVGELRQACEALGVADHRYLGGIGRWRDSGMAGTATNEHPRAFVAGDLAEQALALREVLDQVRPQVVVTYGPDGGYGHPDHVRAHEITMAATAESPYVERVFHTVASRSATAAGVAALSTVDNLPYRLPKSDELPVVEDDEITTVIGIADSVPAKVRGLRAHATQISFTELEDGVPCYALSNGVAQPVLDAEYYVLATGDPEGAADDLFGGLASTVDTGAPR